MSSFAVVITIKNEQKLILQNIQHHLNLGAAKIFVYLDGTTDGSEALLKNIDERVIVRETYRLDQIQNMPEWIREIAPGWQENMDFRKRINTYQTALECAKTNIDWLYSIDADELIIFDSLTNEKIDVSAFHDSLDESVDQVLLRNLEALPSTKQGLHPFLSTDLFLRRFPLTEFFHRVYMAGIRRIVRVYLIVAWLDSLFYWVRFLGTLPRIMRNPIDGTLIPGSYYLGYNNCKPGIRCSRAHEFCFNIHKWVFAVRRPKSVFLGNILHYDLPSVEYFIAKFKQRSAVMMIKAFHVRYKLGEIAMEQDQKKIEYFFNNWIALNREGLREKLTKKGIAIAIPRSIIRIKDPEKSCA